MVREEGGMRYVGIGAFDVVVCLMLLWRLSVGMAGMKILPLMAVAVVVGVGVDYGEVVVCDDWISSCVVVW